MKRAEIESHHEKLFGFEAGIDVLRVLLTADKEASAYQGYERECGLGHDEKAAGGIGTPANGVAAASRFQRVCEIGRRSFDGGDSAKERAGDQCNAESEQQYVRIERQVHVI